MIHGYTVYVQNVSLVLFPSVSLKIKSTHQSFNRKWVFWGVFCFCFFACFFFSPVEGLLETVPRPPNILLYQERHFF